MLYNGDLRAAGSKCIAQVLVGFRFDTAAKKYQVKSLRVEMPDSLLIGKGMSSAPGGVVIDQPHHGLHNFRVAAYDKDLCFIHGVKIVGSEQFAVDSGVI